MATPKRLDMAFGTVLGCDPELFVARQAGKVRMREAAVGSEHVVPPAGLPIHFIANHQVTRDGVQVELHAGGTSGCRQSLATSIQRAFSMLNNAVVVARLVRMDPSIAITFKPLIELTKTDLYSLSPESRELNCKPSLNAYGREQVFRDGSLYRVRTASGHLHLGTGLMQAVRDPNDVVKILDVLVGIPCVLVDQHPSQAIRRETYGRAGEYRLPQHGLEYRVPSNFWLLDYKLESMVFGLAKTAMRIAEAYTTKGFNQWAKDALLDKIDFEKVETAINTNDYDMALRIWAESIKPFANQIEAWYGIGNGLMDDFEYFIDTVHEEGLKRWFDVSDAAVLNRWLRLDYAIGWERFLTGTVQLQRRAAAFTGIVLDPEKVFRGVDGGIKVVKRRSRSVTAAESLRLAA